MYTSPVHVVWFSGIYFFARKIYMAYSETPTEGEIMFEGFDNAAKTMVAATVLGVGVAVATNYGMKAYDHIKAKRAEKKNLKTQND